MRDVRIVSISSSRADVGILTPVWQALSERGAELHIVATGMHRAAGAPKIDLGGIRAVLHEAGRDLGGRADAAAAAAMGEITTDCGELYARLRPDLILVMGDRLDMLPAAIASLPFNIPLAHLHGGEVTEGAIDDRARHAITKLSSLHLVSCASAAQRIQSMGEDASRIIVTGAPGLDTLLAAPVLTRFEFLVQTGLAGLAGAEEGFVVATVHPETNAPDPQAPMSAVLGALDEIRAPVLFTAPNSDPGGAAMRSRLAHWASLRPSVIALDTLGSVLYPNALRHASVMVGNSSSGIIEAGLFGLPVVDVGDRQRGRERGANVRHCPSDATAVRDLLREALSGAGQRAPHSIYGEGASGDRVAEALISWAGGMRDWREGTSPA